jgi:hypothetical protein
MTLTDFVFIKNQEDVLYKKELISFLTWLRLLFEGFLFMFIDIQRVLL